MGMSTHVVGFRPADEKWKKMKAIWDSCNAAGINPPPAVRQFFQDDEPGDRPGTEVCLGPAVTPWTDNCREGYAVDLTKLPPDVKVLWFYNAY